MPRHSFNNVFACSLFSDSQSSTSSSSNLGSVLSVNGKSLYSLLNSRRHSAAAVWTCKEESQLVRNTVVSGG